MMMAGLAASLLTLGVPAGAQERGCTQADIEMFATRAAGVPPSIPEAGGDFMYGLRFSLVKALDDGRCTHPPMLPNDMGMPQPVDVPFCFEVFDTTMCDGTSSRTDGSTCMAGQRVGANVPVRVSVGSIAKHGNKFCLAIPKVRDDNNVTVLATPNAIKDRQPHRIIVIMSNPARVAYFDIVDDD